MIPEIRWTRAVWDVFEELSPNDQFAIVEKLPALQLFPRMYPVRRDGEFAGCRYLVAAGWIVYYQPLRDAIWIRAIGPSRARPL